MRISAIVLFVIISQFAKPLHAQLREKYSNYTESTYRSTPYGFFKPKKIDPKKTYPLVVYLHGSSDLVSRDLLLYNDSIQQKFPCFVLTPKCKETYLGWGSTWTDEHTLATRETLALVDSLTRQYNVDATRLYLYGISMGGFGVFSILSKEPGKFAGAYAVCGGSDIKAAPKLLHTPLWIFHGDKDDIVPVHLSRDVYHEMLRLHATDVKYTEYAGVKHDSWINVGKETALIPWLFSQRTSK